MDIRKANEDHGMGLGNQYAPYHGGPSRIMNERARVGKIYPEGI